MRALVVGHKGMLGSRLLALCREQGIDALGVDRDEVDITRYADLEARMPACDWTFNCAAYTNVDLAEKERDAAFAVNATGAGNVARICSARGSRLIHVSTDYVFDGSLGRPCREDDPVNPLSYYGLTKLEGERAVQAAGGNHVIMRTQSLFGVGGRNFVQTILRLLGTRADPIKVVSDQLSSPTFVGHLVEGMVRLARCSRTGVVHCASRTGCSWYELARAIADRTGATLPVIPIPASEYPTPARRPLNSMLDIQRFREWTGTDMPTWQEALDAYLRLLPPADRSLAQRKDPS